MKKLLFLAAAAATVFASCAKTDIVQKNTGQGDAINFGVYVPKAVTKAGASGTITVDGTGGTTTSLQTTGFGVFAYYSNGATYAHPATTPNFMYNEQVSGASWTYSPLKYWPNETINDNNGATGPAAADVLSFFAYAPWVGAGDNNAFSGSTTEGIVGLTANTATTDPKVSYKVSGDPSKAVDLLWAVAPAGGFSYTDVHGASVSVSEGMPLMNLTKPNTTTKVPFHFRHATARLNLKVVGAYDQVAVGGTLDADTKVTVESVVLDVPSYLTGDLNLNNTTVGANKPYWENLSGSAGTLTVDGDKLNTAIKYGETGANVGSDAANMQDVMASNTFFTLIPKDGSQAVTVTITYYVTTTDAALNGGKSEVQNVITKTVTFADGFVAGKSYTIAMVLGLTSVKFLATVEDWDSLSPSYVDLPINH